MGQPPIITVGQPGGSTVPLGLGIGATILGYADLAFMSTDARLKCPFTSLGVAPEAASSYLMPRLVGWQNAAWLLMSSEWVDAAEALRAPTSATPPPSRERASRFACVIVVSAFKSLNVRDP
jgi:enoyl-CoA hydratase/carnithine racemase